jgi:hypothetical protein
VVEATVSNFQMSHRFAQVKISEIHVAAVFESGVGTSLELPKCGTIPGAYITIAGWFTLETEMQGNEPEIIVLLSEFRYKMMASVTTAERKDVMRGNVVSAGHIAVGFELRVNSLDLPPKFTLEARARVLKPGLHREWRICIIRGCLDQIKLSQVSKFRPVYIMGLGRSGTTVLMRMLGEHPSIVVGPKYPLELCVSTYHARLARLACTFSDCSTYSQSDLFSEKSVVGANPFSSLDYVDRIALDRVTAATAEIFVQAAVRANDVWYEVLAAELGKTYAMCFLEKAVPGEQLVTDLNSYIDARGIVLVRDLRDVFLSRMRFNQKRSHKGFGAEAARNDIHWMEMFLEEARSLMCLHQAYLGRFVAIVRYEELMSDPEGTLTRVIQSLDLESSHSVLKSMVLAGKDRSGLFGEHQTFAEGRFDNLAEEKDEVLKRIYDEMSEFYHCYKYD